MGSQAINEKFQKHLLEEANLFYGEFMNDLSKLIVRISPVRRSLVWMNVVVFVLIVMLLSLVLAFYDKFLL